MLGEGNFTEVYQVMYKNIKDVYFSLKVCSVKNVSAKRKETDIIMEKHALNKIKENLPNTPGNQVAVRLVTTFRDQFNLFFLTELLNHKLELWEHCRSFGMINRELARYTFHKICVSVSKIHELKLVHRDLKVSVFHLPDPALIIFSLKTCF